ncbi:hypothetical protein [Stenotrophomonas maltophilia]|uniref:hypothetical protein n=1 Tax=Stenotrophomonas maltophilia TaxID=40324 RepID=UPI00244C1447|nr:hypothetical protein [Stenotrophomonas maltophilia]MDH1685166.1 hypothetical protein [Stenotrophomonas maltophilia]
MGRKRKYRTDHDHFDDQFEVLPPAPPSFEQEWGYVAASFGLAGDPATDEMCSIPLDAEELEYVEGKLASARQLHRSGEIEAAWYHLGCAKAAVAHKNGFMEGRYQSSDVAGATRVAAQYGKQGSQKKRAISDKKREALALLLLDRHKEEPFKLQRELREAAAKLGPGGGDGVNDDKWGQNLIKQTRLADLYQSLSRRRKR